MILSTIEFWTVAIGLFFLDIVNIIVFKLLFGRVKVFIAAWVMLTPVKMAHNDEGYARHHAYRGNQIVDELSSCTFCHLWFQPSSDDLVARLLLFPAFIIIVLDSVVLTFIHGILRGFFIINARSLIFIDKIIFGHLWDYLVFHFLVGRTCYIL